MLRVCWIVVMLFVLYGCQDKVDTDAVTSGANYTIEQQREMESVDINSYREVSDVFKETGVIKSDGKPYFMVFGANGCVYCERLKDIIKDSIEIKEFLKEDYAPYYINISYSKSHFVEFLDKSLQTPDLIKLYKISSTPTLVFVNAKGKELFVYTGYMPKEKLQKALEFFKDSALENINPKSIKQSFQEILNS